MASDKPSKTYSCVRCSERKVKCDKQHPCSGCVRLKVECIFRVPSAPRRRKKRSHNEVLLARLKQYEKLLQRQGIDVASTPVSLPSAPSEQSETPQDQPHRGSLSNASLILDQGKARFFENHLWSSVSEEFQQPHEAFADSSSEDDSEDEVEDSSDFLLGLTPSSHGRQTRHPPPDQILKLWQLFLENVDPMTKIIHRPTLHEKIVKASSDLESIDKGLETLMFSIYSCALSSISDVECETTFMERRKAMLSKYRRCTRIALSRARFLGTSNIVVLQAFTLYLLIMREDYDARTLWTLVGVASRIAQGLGIHRDGTTIGLPPFETEIRRRLWWQITALDSRSAELTGSGKYGDISLSNTLPPTNVNDEDIWPGMKDPPIGQTRPTEIVSCLIRYDVRNFWKEKLMQKGVSEGDVGITAGFVKAINSPLADTLEERDRHIDELERRLEEKFLRYCDISIPIQFITSVIGRGGVTSMRLMAHHPKHYEKNSDIPAKERELLWDLSLKMLETDNLVHSSRALQRYRWHTNAYFQWHALIYILGELKRQHMGEEAEKAWTQVEEVFHHHPKFITESKKPLHMAVGSLCMKAYSAREQDLEKSGGFGPARVPNFIMQLREQRGNARTDVQPPTVPPQAGFNPHVLPDVFNQPDVTVEQQQPQLEQQQHPTDISQPQQQQSQNFLMPGQTLVSDWQRPSVPVTYFDPTLSPDFINNDSQMDWTQWDNLIQDLEMVN